MPGSTMSYDIENRITQITGSFGTENYKYGPDNNRLRKTRGTSIEHYYFYGAYGELLGVYAPYTSGGITYGNMTVERNLYFAGKLIRSKQTDMFGTVTDAAVVVDRLGSVRKRSNVNVSVYQQFINYPFGEESTGSESNREKFASYFRDKDTGLDYARNRYYASTMGRFNSPDPSLRSANVGNPQSWNRYAYAGNDPTNRSDPSGLDSDCYWTGEGIVCSFPTTFEFSSEGFNYIFQLVKAYYAGPPSGGGPRGVPPTPEKSRAEDFRDSATQLIADKSKTDCEKLARLVYRAGSMGKSTEDIGNILMNGLTEFSTAYGRLGGSSNPNDRVGVRRSDPNYAGGFGDSGFAQAFRDGTNQVRHFAAWLNMGVQAGDNAATTNLLYYMEGTNDPGVPDVALGLQALQLGADFVKSGDYEKLSQDIWHQICNQTSNLKF